MSDGTRYRGFLDRVRWASALIVALGHALGIVASGSHGPALLRTIADMREGAVAVFFILSGYLVGGAVLRSADRFDWRAYVIARFSRIYIVLVPAILLTLLVDGAVRLIDPANPVYAIAWQGGVLGDTALFSRYHASAILGTLLNLEPFTGERMGSAHALWSLGFEWLFYFLFPAIWLPASKRLGQIAGIAALLASLAVLYCLPGIAGPLWCLWLAGAAAYGLERWGYFDPRAAPVLRWLSGAVVIWYLIDGAGRPYALMLPVVGLAGMVFLGAGRQGETRLTSRADAVLAEFSFSLYAIHMPLMAGMAAMLVRAGVLPVGGLVAPAPILALALAMTAISLAVAFVFGRAFERQTPCLARAIGRRVAPCAQGQSCAAQLRTSP